MAAADWQPARAATVAATVLNAPPPPGLSGPIRAAVAGPDPAAVARVLQFACTEVVPRLAATSGEIGAVLRALSGGYVPAGPSGSPTRAGQRAADRAELRPGSTRRPSRRPTPGRLGSRVAAGPPPGRRGQLPALCRADHLGHVRDAHAGRRIAAVLALIGCRPVWDEGSRRVTGFAVVPAEELGRPRIDVTVRISGFFRDAFPHVIALLEDYAMAAVPRDLTNTELNYLAGRTPPRTTPRTGTGAGPRPGTPAPSLVRTARDCSR